MKVIDSQLLKRVKEAVRCEWCHRPTPDGADPHHIHSRGAGRLDIRENLCSLCRWCHSSNHNGKEPTRAQLLDMVAKREGTTAEAIVEKVHRLRRNTLCKVWDVAENGVTA